MLSFRTLMAASISGAALIASADATQASSFAIRSGLSAEGLGLSYAGGASGGIGQGAIVWNPATITMFPGRNSQWNFSYIYPQANYVSTDPLTLGTAARFRVPASTGEIGGDGAFVPASYGTFQITDRLWIGVASGAPWGLRSKPDNQNYVGQVYGRSSTVRSINVAPTVGYQVTPWLSIGAAVQAQYFKADLKQAVSPAFGAPNTILRGDDVAFGYRLGVTLTPWTGGSIGIGYRSSIRHELQGDLISPVAVIPIRVNLNLPDSVTFGLSQAIDPQWQVHLGVEWTNWSRFRRLPVTIDGIGRPVTGLNFEYDDSWFFAAGVEYAWTPDLIFRAGLGYELSAVSDRVRTVRIADNDRLWVSGGVGYQWNERLRFDLSYSHLFVKEAPVTITAASGNPSFLGVPYVAKAEPSVDIVSASITYRWDAAARPVAIEQPVIRKH